MADHVKMRTPEGVEYDVVATLVDAKLAAGWQLFEARDAPSAPQDIPTTEAKAEVEVPDVPEADEETA